MKIQKATLKDLSKIWEIYLNGIMAEVSYQYPKVPKEEILRRLKLRKKEKVKEFKESINSKYGNMLVVLENEKIIAFGDAKIDKLFKDEGKVQKVYVKKDSRKKGIGKKLVQELIRWLEQNKVKRIHAELYVKNIPSTKLYERFGFKTTLIKVERIKK